MWIGRRCPPGCRYSPAGSSARPTDRLARRASKEHGRRESQSRTRAAHSERPFRSHRASPRARESAPTAVRQRAAATEQTGAAGRLHGATCGPRRVAILEEVGAQIAAHPRQSRWTTAGAAALRERPRSTAIVAALEVVCEQRAAQHVAPAFRRLRWRSFQAPRSPSRESSSASEVADRHCGLRRCRRFPRAQSGGPVGGRGAIGLGEGRPRRSPDTVTGGMRRPRSAARRRSRIDAPGERNRHCRGCVRSRRDVRSLPRLFAAA